MTIHPVVTATSSAASTTMNALSVTRLPLHVAPPVAVLRLLFESPPVTVSVLPVSTVVNISLVCVDCRQFIGVILKYSVMTVVVVGHDGAMRA